MTNSRPFRAFSSMTLSVGVATAATITLLCGCTVGPNYAGPPAVRTPDAFSSLREVAGRGGQTDNPYAATGARELTADELALWWKVFNDPALDSLVARALGGNLDLRLAQARVREARALRGIERSNAFPRANAGAGYSRFRGSDNLGRGSESGGNGANNLFDIGLDASWEIDVFGGVRRAVQAADADLDAAYEARRDTVVTLVAEVARNYAELRGAQRRVEVTLQAVQAQRDTLELTRSLSAAGLAAELAVEQSAAQLASREAALPRLHVSVREASHRLAVLLGEEPGALLDELAPHQAIPTPPAEVPVGIPSELLRRRPDIRQAERAIAAASARVGVATADLFPKFSLTGAFGFQSDEVGSLIDMNSRYYSIGPAVRWNIFDAGSVRQRIAAANAREEAAIIAYEQGVYLAFEEVENSIVRFIQEQQRRRSLESAATASRRALALATDRYRSGIGDFLEVLDAQRAVYAFDDEIVQSQTAVTTSLISLYKALGGGWNPGNASGDSSTDSPITDAPPTPPDSPPDTLPNAAPAVAAGDTLKT
ncbi:MAG: efflux transporter outer membrane subunit [Phycisphaeraceae bacterium]|nr:efflux transporter outer membrane subunit [Phycisphaeraceae bacterium]